MIDGKLNAKRLCEYKKQSHEEFEGVVSEFLYGNSLLRAGEHDEQHKDRGHRHVTTARHLKQRRKEKQVVMFTDQISGRQLRLLPRMSLWQEKQFAFNVIAAIKTLDVISCFVLVVLSRFMFSTPP
jgi:hypothetical protein